MKTKLFLAALCMLILPVLFTSAGSRQGTATVPFATIAIAGHSLAGGWCDCGPIGCICDPGENPGGNSAVPVSDGSSSERKPKNPAPEFDFGTGALLIGLAVFLWSRLRA